MRYLNTIIIALLFVFGASCSYSIPVNCLGQPISDNQKTDYELINNVIYKNGIPERKIEITENLNDRIEKIHWLDTDIIIKKEYRNNLLIKESKTNGNIEKSDYFYYIDGILKTIISYENNKIINKKDYITNDISNNLISIETLSGVNLFSEQFISIGDNVFKKIGNNLINYSENAILSDDKTYITTNNGIKYQYSSDGLVISKEDERYKYSYEYNFTGELEKEIITNDEDKFIKYYEKGIIKTEENYKNNILQEKIYYNEDTVHEIFREGKPYAKIYYGKNTGIKKVEYLENESD